jgi:Carboxypeptidase regulatory-like domain
MRILLLALAAISAQAAVIRGSVVENLTGKPLARAVVVLQPIEGTPGDRRSLRATSLGGFEFDNLAAGSYVLKASRKGFMAAEYGQKRWNSAGTPVSVREGETAFLNVRLPRFSAIAGTVLDENDIGLPEHEVAAYRLRSPPELVATAKADDRGRYRIHGLEPGSYVVRTIGKQYDDGAYLPTYSREAGEMRNAVRVDLLPEQQVDHVDVRPAPGRLFSVKAVTSNFPPGAEITITMAGETGRKSMKADFYQFTGLVPGEYDFYAEAPVGEGLATAYQRINVSKDSNVSLIASPGSGLFVSGVPEVESSKLWVRHKDMAGAGEVKQWPLTRGRATIPAGRWELFLEPPAAAYVSSFYGGMAYRGNRGRADGWNEAVAGDRRSLQFQLVSGPGSLRGSVKSGSDFAAGTPVYLEGWDPVAKQRVGELRTIRTDARGQFRFEGLAPGSYRVLATFEYLNPDVETMDATAQEIMVAGHAEKTQDLELFVIR